MPVARRRLTVTNDGSFGAGMAMAPVSIAAPAR
jgi:hypothetical protein